MRDRQVLAIFIVLLLGVVFATPATAGAIADPVAQQSLECTYPLTFEDATGTNVTVQSAPEEIVALHAGSAQVLHDIDAWDRVIGAPVTPFTAYLDNYDAPQDVTGEDGFPNREKIVNLSPDLVLADSVANPDTIERLRDDGLTVYMNPQPASVDDIAAKVERYGQLVGACDSAEERVSWMASRLDDLPAPGDDDPLVYYALGGGWTAGVGTFQADMIERAGGRNLASIADIDGWNTINEETVIDLDPEWIVYGDSAAAPPVSEAVRETTAIEQNQTLAVDANYINQAGPRVVYVIETMAEAFHGSDDDALNETDAASDGTTDDAPSNETDAGDDPEEAETALVGFGAATAIAALGTLALLGRLR